MNITLTDQTTFIAFWLVFTRWLTIMIQLPLFDNVSIPAVVKAISALVISFAFFPFLEASMVREVQTVGVEHLWGMTLFQAITGLFIGYIVKSIMMIFISAGSIMTQQMGFGALRYFNPSIAETSGPFEIFLNWTILIIVISSGALIPMFKGALMSFDAISLSQLHILGTSPQFFLKFFKEIFAAAIMLASPLIFTNILVMIILGIVARVVPQMNVLMVSFVINIGVGLLVFSLISNEFFYSGFKIYTEKLSEWFLYIT